VIFLDLCPLSFVFFNNKGLYDAAVPECRNLAAPRIPLEFEAVPKLYVFWDTLIFKAL
jgi:hypothetical protein